MSAFNLHGFLSTVQLMSRQHPEQPPALAQSPIEEIEDEDIDGDSIVSDEEYGDMRVIADALVTNDGEAIADVLQNIRDILDKMNKILYKIATKGD
jgi:transcription antitermination factor NusA-like protein